MKQKRRLFISRILLYLAGFFAFLVGLRHLWMYVVRRLKREAVQIFAGRISDMKEDVKEIKFRDEILLIIKKGGKVETFSSTCPHLGCKVEWIPSEKRFKCPCHGAVFDEDGRVLSGPAPSPLKKIPTDVKDGEIMIEVGLYYED